ncbi:hypothetical protein KIN20_020787, partial [Parelaphostrongylus tenuis]
MNGLQHRNGRQSCDSKRASDAEELCRTSAEKQALETFTVTGFTTLPVAMVYAGKPEVSNRDAGIAANEAGAKAFVERLVMQT